MDHEHNTGDPGHAYVVEYEYGGGCTNRTVLAGPVEYGQRRLCGVRRFCSRNDAYAFEEGDPANRRIVRTRHNAVQAAIARVRRGTAEWDPPSHVRGGAILRQPRTPRNG